MHQNSSKYTLITGLLLSAGIALSGYFIANAIRYYRNFDRVVEVKGLAETVVHSNNGVWSISYSATGNDLSKASAKINQDGVSIRDFLAQNGFESSEIQLGVLNVIDNYANQYSSGSFNADVKNRVPQYQVIGNITLNTTKVDLLVHTVQQTSRLIQDGVLISSNSLNYYYNDLNSIKPAMLDNAVNNAKTSAASFAQNTGSSIGGIKSATQGLFSIMSVDGGNSNDTISVDKKVRVVTSMQFFIK